jgi:hypothetical protein
MDYTTDKKMIPEIIRMYLGRLSKDKRRQEKTRERREDNYHYSAGVQQKYYHRATIRKPIETINFYRATINLWGTSGLYNSF